MTTRSRANHRVAPTVALLAFVLWIAGVPVVAQSAVDYYHDAARLYIAEDNAQAERAALAGLGLAPDDAKLQALLEKIRERNEQQQQQNGEGEQEEQDDADQEQQGEGEQQQDENDAGQPQPGDEGEQQEQAGEEQSQEQQQPEGPADEPPSDEREGTTGQESEPSEGEPQSGGEGEAFDAKPDEMSRAEAERILRAIQADELQLLRDVQRRRARPRYVEKDW